MEDERKKRRKTSSTPEKSTTDEKKTGDSSDGTGSSTTASTGALKTTSSSSGYDFDLSDESLLYIAKGPAHKRVREKGKKLARISDYADKTEKEIEEETKPYTRKNNKGELITNIGLVPLKLKKPRVFYSTALDRPDKVVGNEIIETCKLQASAPTSGTSTFKLGEDSKFDEDDEINKTILKPNHTYVLLTGEGRDVPYTYKTDDKGRVKFVTGKLEKGDPKEYRTTVWEKEAVKLKGGTTRYEGLFLNSDNAGHIFAAEFSGPDALINFFPQHEVANQHGQWKKMENEIHKWLTKTDEEDEPMYEVTLNVVFYYPDPGDGPVTEALRPFAVDAMYSVTDIESKEVTEYPLSIENPNPVRRSDVMHGSHFKMEPKPRKTGDDEEKEEKDDDFKPSKDKKKGKKRRSDWDDE